MHGLICACGTIVTMVACGSVQGSGSLPDASVNAPVDSMIPLDTNPVSRRETTRTTISVRSHLDAFRADFRAAQVGVEVGAGARNGP